MRHQSNKMQHTIHNVKHSFKNLARNPLMTTIAIGSTALMLTLVGLFMTVILNAGKLTSDIENNVTITTFLELNTADNAEKIKDKDGKEITNPDYQKIYDSIMMVKNVDKVTYSSKEQELDKLVKVMGKTWDVFEDMTNPLHDVYVVEVTKPEHIKAVAKELEKTEGVSHVDYGGKTTSNLFTFGRNIRFYGLIGVIILISVAVFLISNTIRVAIMSRTDEIKIMRLVGSRNINIKVPFVLEAIWLGLFGAILPAFVVAWVYNLMYSTYTQAFVTQNIAMYKPGTFLPLVIFVLIFLSVAVGAVGASMSMKKYLKI